MQMKMCEPPSLLIYAGVEALVHVDVGNVESLPCLGNVAGDTLANREPQKERGDISHGMWRSGQYYIFIEKSELLKIDRYGIGVNIYLFLFCDLSYYDNHNMPTKPPTSIKCMQFNFESSYNKATTKNIKSSTTKSKFY